MSGGPVEIEDITELFEAWIQVLPEEQQENRRHLMNVITKLNQIKAQGHKSPVQIFVETESDLDPTLLEGDNVEVIELESNSEIIDLTGD